MLEIVGSYWNIPEFIEFSSSASLAVATRGFVKLKFKGKTCEIFEYWDLLTVGNFEISETLKIGSFEYRELWISETLIIGTFEYQEFEYRKFWVFETLNIVNFEYRKLWICTFKCVIYLTEKWRCWSKQNMSRHKIIFLKIFIHPHNTCRVRE